MRYEPHFTAVLVTSLELHQPREFVEKQLGEISLKANEEIKVIRQTYFDAQRPGFVVGQYKKLLEEHLWREMERSAIATLIEPLMPCELVNIGYHEITVSRDGKDLEKITRDSVRTVNRAFHRFPDDQVWASNFVSARAIANEIDRKRIAADTARRSFIGGTPASFPR